MDLKFDQILSSLSQYLSVPITFYAPPTYPISFRKPCQGKFSLLAPVTALPFSQLRMMDSGAHCRSKGMEGVLIKSVLFSSVFQIQTSVTLGSCCTVNARMILKTVARLALCFLALRWKCLGRVFVTSSSLCGGLQTMWWDSVGNCWLMCGLSCQTDASHLKKDGLRHKDFYDATGLHSLSVHSNRIDLD